MAMTWVRHARWMAHVYDVYFQLSLKGFNICCGIAPPARWPCFVDPTVILSAPRFVSWRRAMRWSAILLTGDAVEDTVMLRDSG